MPLNPSLSLQVEPLQIEPPQNALLRALQLQKAQQDNEIGTMKADEYRRGVADQNALRGALAAGADPYNALLKIGNVKGAADWRESQSKQEKEKAAAAKDNQEVKGKQYAVLANTLKSVQDQSGYDNALMLAEAFGMDTKPIPRQFNPQLVSQMAGMFTTEAQKWADQRAREQHAETVTHNRNTEGITVRGQDLVNARGVEANRISAGQLGVAQGNLGLSRQRLELEKNAPKGTYDPERGLLVDPRTATAVPVTQAGAPIGPKDKALPEAAQKQIVGARNVRDAIDDYVAKLQKFGLTGMMRPDKRAEMGNAYNNMMLQAKEMYNLGVLNGPDYEILQSVVKDPTKLSSVGVSNEAMSQQATELRRISQGIEKRVLEAHGKQTPTEPAKVLRFDAKGNPVK